MTTAVVTGANRGIGLELVRQLHARGDELVAVCRRSSEALDALGVRVEAGIDVSRGEDVAELARRLGELRVDLLVNNAGILRRDGLDNLDPEAVIEQFVVNALGPLRVTAALRDHLAEGAKVGIVTSRMASIEDNDSGGAYGYRMSKAAVNAAGKSLAIDLRPRKVAVALLHPGWVRTEMTRNTGHVEPAEAAAGLIARLDALTLEGSGGFWHMNGERLPW